ncbi:hypothetical protein BJ912DRAFT_202800 [Pholiota molesta]|nr:hypothetical protein BJ912DRAFT_202800 [Pholiota molesta]
MTLYLFITPFHPPSMFLFVRLFISCFLWPFFHAFTSYVTFFFLSVALYFAVVRVAAFSISVY